MRKTPARFLLVIAATLVLVLICYGLARAYLYYEAARAEHMIRELGDVKLGDSEAQVLPILERYGIWRRTLEPYMGSNKTDYKYMVDIGPSGIYYYYADPANTSMFYRITRAVLGNVNPRLRRAIGLRRWNVYGRVGFKDKRVKVVVGTVMVEGSHEWLSGGWGLEQTIPPSLIDRYVTKWGVSWPHDANHYLVGWSLLIGMEKQNGGENASVSITPDVTDQERRSAHEFRWNCLTSRSGCRTVCDLYPAAQEYADTGTWKERKEACAAPSASDSYW